MIATLLKLDIRQIKVEKKILICVIFLDCESAEQNRTKICYEYIRIFFHIKKNRIFVCVKIGDWLTQRWSRCR